MYTCIYVYMNMCMYAHMFIHAYIYVYMRTYSMQATWEEELAAAHAQAPPHVVSFTTRPLRLVTFIPGMLPGMDAAEGANITCRYAWMEFAVYYLTSAHCKSAAPRALLLAALPQVHTHTHTHTHIHQVVMCLICLPYLPYICLRSPHAGGLAPGRGPPETRRMHGMPLQASSVRTITWQSRPRETRRMHGEGVGARIVASQ